MENLTYTEFKNLVAEMREAQRGFFKAPPMTNEKTAFLVRSKRLEAKVDEALKAGPKQQTLFDAAGASGEDHRLP